MTPGLAQFKLSYTISPIYLTGGIASNMAGGGMPLISYLNADSFPSVVSVASSDENLDNFFATFVPITGGTLVANQVGEYPFANQATAANAIITSPLNMSMMMICPVRRPGDYARKSAILTALKATLDQHNTSGGTYMIATPAFLYTDCLLTSLRDISGGESKQAQWRWQFDFRKPLITLQDAQQAHSAQMSKISNGVAYSPNSGGDFPASSPDVTVGNPASGASPTVVPAGDSSPGLGYSGSLDTVFPGVGG